MFFMTFPKQGFTIIIQEVIEMNDTAELICFALRLAVPVIMLIIICLAFLSLRFGQRDKHALIALDDEIKKVRYPVLYWENSLGRSRGSDIKISDATVSRDHAVLLRREAGWFITDTGSKAGVFVNDQKISGRQQVFVGDRITLGTTILTLRRADDPTDASVRKKIKPPKVRKTVPCGILLTLITILIAILSLEGLINTGSLAAIPHALIFCTVMWGFYTLSAKLFQRKNFELESLAMLLSGVGIVLCAVHNPRQAYTQLIAFVIGIVFFCFMIWFMEVPDRVMKWRIIIYFLAIGMLLATLALGRTVNGAKNWIFIGSVSVQPSEFAKIALIFVGASTLDQLQTKKNLFGFILFTGACVGIFFLMSDFGTALIFFVTFLIISFMRSGDFKTLILAVAAAIIGVMLILTVKPYIADRFQAWGHVWQYADSAGYQQVKTFISSAAGGLFGLGLTKGELQYVFASESDLVFGLASEEIGLIAALLLGVVIGGIMIYSKAVTTTSRSAFYSIAACTTGGMLVFQAALNIFGVVDILPLTGVTLPFVSYGGTSMITSWGLLAFIKSADERTYSQKKLKGIH